MHSLNVQIAMDAANPHELVKFWADVLGYVVEDNHDLVGEMIAAGYATAADTVEIDGRWQWAEARACHDADGRGPRIYLQKVSEPKTVKDRVHLDLQFGPEHRAAEVARITALGATTLWEGHQGPHGWTTMADPEGNEFCVS